MASSRGHILLTGGAGYIGSHVAVALAEQGYTPVIVDNFSNARRSVIDRIGRIIGAPVICEEIDILDTFALASVFRRYPIRAAVHFAAKKAVGESTRIPLEYFRTNISGLIGLMQAMQEAGVFTLVFSSSATVYGEADEVPTPETAPLSYTSPYAYTKVSGEQILEQAAALDPRWRIGRLRYFNPVGAHPSGLIGEDPRDIPNNLMPHIAKVAVGELPEIQVFGDDYDTPDGTGVRDYIHVCDLARGHVLSLARLEADGAGHLVNVGTGRGYSVLDMIASYSRACGRELPYRIVARRPGDVPVYLADPSKAAEVLGFRTEYDLDEMCRTNWHWITTGAVEAAAGEDQTP